MTAFPDTVLPLTCRRDMPAGSAVLPGTDYKDSRRERYHEKHLEKINRRKGLGNS